MPDDRELTAALLEVVRERMEQENVSIGRLAEAMSVQRPTLSRQLRGVGVLTIDEWEALAAALSSTLEDLLAAGRRRL